MENQYKKNDTKGLGKQIKSPRKSCILLWNNGCLENTSKINRIRFAGNTVFQIKKTGQSNTPHIFQGSTI